MKRVRKPVQITPHRGRLPDIVFVRKERASIVQGKGIYGTPDLVVEILSPKDTLADIVALEADYQSIGASEIWIIDQWGAILKFPSTSALDLMSPQLSGLLRH